MLPLQLISSLLSLSVVQQYLSPLQNVRVPSKSYVAFSFSLGNSRCPNARIPRKADRGTIFLKEWVAVYLKDAHERLAPQLKGIDLTIEDTYVLQQVRLPNYKESKNSES